MYYFLNAPQSLIGFFWQNIFVVFVDKISFKNTECVRDLDKINFVKLGNGGSVLGLGQFLLLLQLPQQMTLASKVVKSESIIIILLCWSKSVTHSVQQPLG